MSQWYYRSPGEEPVGPITSAGLRRLISNQRIVATDEVRREGEERWRPVSGLRLTEGAARAPESVATPARSLGAILVVAVAALLLGVGGTWYLLKGRAEAPANSIGSTHSAETRGTSDRVSGATRDAAESMSKGAATEEHRSTVAEPVEHVAGAELRAEYRALAKEIQAGNSILYSWLPTDGLPIEDVVHGLDQLGPELSDATMRSVAQRVRNWWSRLPESLPVYEPDSLFAILANMVLDEFYDGLSSSWSRLLGDFQELCWSELQPYVQSQWGIGAEREDLAAVSLVEVDSTSQGLDIELHQTAGASLTDATVRVEFELMGAKPITNHYFFADWPAGASEDLSRDPRLLYGGSLVVSAKVSVWCDQGVQVEREFEFPERRAAIEAYLARIERIRANRAALETALAEGRRLEGAWALGAHAGAIGFELIQRAKSAGPFTGTDEVRLYDPANPTVFKTYRGAVAWDNRNLRYELRLTGRSGGLQGNTPRMPCTEDYLARVVRPVRLFGDGQDFRGIDSAGASLQLHPAGSAEAKALLAAPETLARTPLDSGAHIEPLESAVLAAAPATSSRTDAVPVERERWSVVPEPPPAMIFPTIRQVEFLAGGKAILLRNESDLLRIDLASGKREIARNEVERYTLEDGEAHLVTTYSSFYRIRDAKSLGSVGPADPDRPDRFRSEPCADAAAVSGGRVVYGTARGELHLMSRAGTEVWSTSQSGRVARLVVPAGSQLVFCSMADGNLNLWDLEKHEYVGQLRKTYALREARLAPNGKVAMTIEADERRATWYVRFWDLATMALLREQPFYECSFVTVSDDWRRAVVGERSDGLGHLWNLETGDVVAPLIGHKEAITSADFSSDGKQLLTGSAYGWAIRWTLE